MGTQCLTDTPARVQNAKMWEGATNQHRAKGTELEAVNHEIDKTDSE